MGTFFIWFFTIQGQVKKLAAAQAIAAIQALVARPTAHCNVPADVASRGVTLH